MQCMCLSACMTIHILFYFTCFLFHSFHHYLSCCFCCLDNCLAHLTSRLLQPYFTLSHFVPITVHACCLICKLQNSNKWGWLALNTDKVLCQVHINTKHKLRGSMQLSGCIRDAKCGDDARMQIIEVKWVTLSSVLTTYIERKLCNT